MKKSPEKRKIAFADAVAKLPGPRGECSARVFEHASLKSLGRLTPDMQTPHTRDEVYVVVQGVSARNRDRFGPGDFIFAAAGEEHRFKNFSDDLSLWVLFYGPEGGKSARSNRT